MKHILLQKILKDDITGKKKKQKSGATEAFSKNITRITKGKSDLADNPQSKKLQNKVEQLQKEYNLTVKHMEDGF